jgi:hypothetical protein
VQDILHGERFEERGLARPGLPYDGHMRKPIGLFDAEESSLISKIGSAEI